MSRSPLTLSTLAIAFSLSMAAISGPAQAQTYSNDIMSKCAQVVGPMKFEGWGADRNREMMMLACQSNGGRIPGAAEEKPVALPHHKQTRQH